MRWEGRRESDNIEDMRGQGAGRVVMGGGILTLVVLVASMVFGFDPRGLLMLLQQGQPRVAPAGPAEPLSEDDVTMGKFVSVVLADTEDVWTEVFREMGTTYKPPVLQMFTGSTQSACGGASSAMGPFYCPLDRKVYIDLDFYEELKKRFRAPGDFAQAYVVAHEVGHHVQNLLGISRQVQSQRPRLSEEEYNRLSVRLELQADFLAGFWAKRGDEMNQFLERGDVDEALRCASAIGDDTLQKQAQGYAVPDSFTHGTSEQRMAAFRMGFEARDISEMDKFIPRPR